MNIEDQSGIFWDEAGVSSLTYRNQVVSMMVRVSNYRKRSLQ